MLKPGDTFERYTVDAAIGQGGMGCVYRAHDARLDRRVALKVISDGITPGGDSGDATARLLREARSAAALDHPNAVSIFDVGDLNGSPYIVMELVSGRTLREVIGASREAGQASVPVSTRVRWLGDVARALSAAHRRGLVHRDIKPENVMVRDDGVVKVLDFGIARRVPGAGQVDASAPTQATALPTLTKEGIKVGTPVYMAPEQIRGDALDGRADQFAWGVLAYEMLTGKPPWRGAGDPLAVVASILTDEVSGDALAGAGVPAEVAAVVRRALEKKAADRFATMDDLLIALEESKGEVVSARERAVPSSGAPRSRPSAPVSSSRQAPAPPAQGPSHGTLLQRYSTEEVQEILSRAVEQQEARRADTRLGFEDLVAAAREVGVEPEVLRQASRDLRTRQQAEGAEGAAFASWKARRRLGFLRHLGIWAIVCTAMMIVSRGDFLPPTVLWAIGVAIQGLNTFTATEDDWRRERDKQAEKRRKKQRRSQAIDRALDDGAAALLEAGEALRRRVETPEPPRVRVAADTGPNRQAQAQAEAAEAEAEAAHDAQQAPDQRRRR